MDVNGTRFHLLLSEQDWAIGTRRRGEDHGLEWDEERSGVSLRSEVRRFPTPPGSRALTPSDRRGAAADAFGDWFTIAADRRHILLLGRGHDEPRLYWPRVEQPQHGGGVFASVASPSSEPPPELKAMVVTNDHYLLVGVPSLPGLFMFDLHGGGPPEQLVWPADDVGFDPVDMAPAVDGGAWILDRAPGLPGLVRLWLVDRYLRLASAGKASPVRQEELDFRPVGPDREVQSATAPVPSMPTPATVPAQDAVAIEALPDGSVLVLDRRSPDGPAAVVRLSEGQRLEFLYVPDTVGSLAHDFAFVPDPADPTRAVAGSVASAGATAAGRRSVRGLLLVVDADGNQAFPYRLSADGRELTALLDYYPLRMFSGKGIVAHGGVIHYDMGDRWLPIVPRQGRTYLREGSIRVGPFDGLKPGCVWHRIIFDGCVPPGAEVVVETRAAEAADLLEGCRWEEEPRPRLRAEGAEVPVYEPFPDPARHEGVGTWELLVQRAAGRYLEVRLTLRGDGRRSPRVSALRIYFPRFSYLRQYLPAVYQQDVGAASFLERYLANVEGFYTAIEGRIETSQSLFDPSTAPAAFLPWLASWLGGAMESEWEETRRRLFLRYAVRLFRQRGTHDGLVRAIRLAVEECPDDSIFLDPVSERLGPRQFTVRIVESFRTRVAAPVAVGDPTDTEGPRVSATTDRWSPAEGTSALHERWRAFLQDLYQDPETLRSTYGATGSELATMSFPPLLPHGTTEAVDWRRFAHGVIGPAYEEVSEDDADAFRSFLTGRYRRIDALNSAWNLSGGSRWSSFADVQLPSAFPSQGAELRDWLQFASVVLPTARRAHRFTVLVPIGLDEPDHVRDRRIGRVAHVVAVERPAHASFEVKGFWAAFRVGEARIGYETIVGEGSRFAAIVLGRARLAATFVPGAPPWDVPTRFVVGRNGVAIDERLSDGMKGRSDE